MVSGELIVNSVYLRLAAPLQSWAGARVSGNIVHTEMRPTISGIRGLIAACAGIPRGRYPDWITDLQVEIRVDKAGAVVDEYQTINPRNEDLEYQERLYLLMTGKRYGKSSSFTPDAGSGTSIVQRTYLADAEFLVALTGDAVQQANDAIRQPVFTPYLGRKAFAPSFPFYLGTGPQGLLVHLPTIGDNTQANGGRLLAHYVEASDQSQARLQLWSNLKHQIVTVPLLDRARWLTEIGTQLRR